VSPDNPVSADPRRAYWSERTGKRTRHVSLTPEQVRTLFASLIAELEEKGDLQEAFGYECVDNGFVPGGLGPAISERMLLILGHADLWPISPDKAAAWDDDEFFDVVEFLYDHVSEGDPDSGGYHSYSNCGWHFRRFDSDPARVAYRSRVNELLSRLDGGYELSEQGQILRSTPDGLDPLLDATLPGLTLDDVDHVSAAIQKFRSRSSSTTQRRDAVRDLADVLESIRADVKVHMFNDDERALFEIANKFWIRHNKPGERRHYDHEAWWSWLFYLYLDSIALVTHLRERDD
jgi:hypothetical protein